MRRGLVFLLFGLLSGTLVWGQVEKPSVNTEQNKQNLAGAGAEIKSSADSSVAPGVAVISISGLCSGSKDARTAPSDCRTVITRAQFEELIQLVQPNLSQAERKAFASSYAETLILAEQAKKMDLDGGPQFEALMNLQRARLLWSLLGQALRQKAEQIPDQDIEKYYKEHSDDYEEVELERVYVPIVQQFSKAGLSSTEVQKRQQESMLAMKKTAEDLRARAVTGADFSQLQADAYKAAATVPPDNQTNVEMEKRRRRSLSPAELPLLDLKPGEISQLVDESNGHYIYKMGARRMLPLEEVRAEISKTLRVERLQQYQQEVRQSATATFNDEYFKGTTSTAPQNGGEEP
ncbi:MAG: peptidylprolyl isomerase [Candidatus Sulfotelmatobacter sp.]